jgi:hypothetical protein
LHAINIWLGHNLILWPPVPESSTLDLELQWISSFDYKLTLSKYNISSAGFIGLEANAKRKVRICVMSWTPCWLYGFFFKFSSQNVYFEYFKYLLSCYKLVMKLFLPPYQRTKEAALVIGYATVSWYFTLSVVSKSRHVSNSE